jgi:CBS-domain-containing membrane protein
LALFWGSIMSRIYQPLSHRPLLAGVQFQHPAPPSGRVRLDSPALEVMTDLRKVPAATIDADAPLDAANRFMIRRGVRLLLVADDRRQVLGLITATDILGERPVTFAVERGVKRQDIVVHDIMTPRERLDVLWYAELAGAEVGHVVVTLKAAGRQHALVAESGSDGAGQTVRGIFSLSQIARQLGVTIVSTEVARTFAEIETALGR